VLAGATSAQDAKEGTLRVSAGEWSAVGTVPRGCSGAGSSWGRTRMPVTRLNASTNSSLRPSRPAAGGDGGVVEQLGGEPPQGLGGLGGVHDAGHRQAGELRLERTADVVPHGDDDVVHRALGPPAEELLDLLGQDLLCPVDLAVGGCGCVAAHGGEVDQHQAGSCATAGATSRRKVAGLTDAGTEVSATVGIDVGHTPHNHHYLQTKRTAMNHHLPSLDALVGGTTTPRPAAGGTNAAEGLA